jgi:DNA-binding NarL/FixJ family response regulator
MWIADNGRHRLVTKKMRTLIVEDQTVMRDGLQALLASEPDFEVVGATAEGESAIRAAATLHPNIILMDLSISHMSGTDAITRIKRKHPEIKIVVLTLHKEDKFIQAALQAGADAYVLKDDNREELFTALLTAVTGRRYLSPSILERVIMGYLDRTTETPSWEILTDREQEVMKLIAEGYRTKDIAAQLTVSPRTVETHRTNLMKKLDLASVSAVTAYAIANGIIAQ